MENNTSDKRPLSSEFQENKAMYQSVLNSSSDTIAVTNLKGEILYVSPQSLKMFGYSNMEDILTRSVFDFMDNNDHERAHANLISIFQGSQSGANDYLGLRSDGSTFNVEVKGNLLMDNEGNPDKVVYVIRDITERKTAQDKFEKLNRLYMVISHINRAIIRYRAKDQLINEVCRIAIEYGKFKFAWIGLVDEKTMLIQPVVSRGHDAGFLSVFNPISILADPDKRGPIGSAIRLGEHFVFDDILNDDRAGDWKKEALERGFRSWITLSIKVFGHIDGTFSLFSEIPNFFIPEEIELLNSVVDELGYAFEAFENESKHKQTEKKLHILSRAVEQSPVSIIISDLSGNIEYANPKTIETTGYTLEELVGKNPRILKSGETSDSDYANLWQDIVEGKEWRGLFHNKHKNGNLYWESATINSISDENGVIAHYLAIKEDITDNLLNAQALLKSEERFSQVAEQCQTVIWEIDTTGLFTYVGQVAETVWGYPPNDLIGKMYFYDLYPAEGREEFKKQSFKTFEKKKDFANFEKRIVTGYGKTIWITTTGGPVLDDQGKLLGYRGADNDITSRKLAEEELLMFRSIADKANYGAAIASLKGDLIYLNAEFAGMHGYDLQELSGKNLTIFHNEEQLPKTRELIEQIQVKGGFSAQEVWHTRKDGTVFPTLMNASLIADQHNIPQYMWTTAIDISAKKWMRRKSRVKMKN